MNCHVAKPYSGEIRRSGGFTLAELIVVLVIAALALSLVGVSISRNISSAEMRAAARDVAAGLRYTRTRAILSREEQVFVMDIESKQFTAADKGAESLPEELEVELNTARSEITSETAAGIRFYPDGGSTGGNVRLSANGRIYRIDIAWLTGGTTVTVEEG